jgi:hypothetical protein
VRAGQWEDASACLLVAEGKSGLEKSSEKEKEKEKKEAVAQTRQKGLQHHGGKSHGRGQPSVKQRLEEVCHDSRLRPASSHASHLARPCRVCWIGICGDRFFPVLVH